MTNHDTDSTTDVDLTFRIPTFSDDEEAKVRTFFAPMLTDDDRPEPPRCPCGCGAVEHSGHGRTL
jgi:hypothetical protein